jgi:hypothetical protein
MVTKFQTMQNTNARYLEYRGCYVSGSWPALLNLRSSKVDLRQVIAENQGIGKQVGPWRPTRVTRSLGSTASLGPINFGVGGTANLPSPLRFLKTTCFQVSPSQTAIADQTPPPIEGQGLAGRPETQRQLASSRIDSGVYFRQSDCPANDPKIDFWNRTTTLRIGRGNPQNSHHAPRLTIALTSPIRRYESTNYYEENHVDQRVAIRRESDCDRRE